MNLIKYFGIQFILFTGIILTGSYSDSYISDPYFYTDLITIFNLKMDGLEHLKKFLVNTKVNPEQYIVNGWKMENGKSKRMYKDSYNSDGSFKHRKHKPVGR
ncbi:MULTISPECIES: hypothetical protein [unclassified Peribacillus]|uniref:hypothetical protein n=1 Tax=unclassified Peribacillus TaxID=2675266 RepID=UPI00191254F5|nr:MULTISPECIES: hypothetical protein [unclassified Peribacillus]MBK5498125.1 hypothetical protein [Peribacillus sp. TH14]WMX56757.1 hypothetical protein RE409_05915 [Peribacillus sp. R9-11]